MKNLIEKIYQELSPYSDEWRAERRLHERTLGLAEKYLGGIAGKRALDIGCGAGLLPYGLALMGAEAHGIDKHLLSERGALGIEDRWKHLGIKAVIGDFAEIQDADFDLVTAENIFEHLPFTQKEFLEKIRAVLNPGGYAILTTPNLAHILKRARMVFGRGPYWDLKDFFLNKQPFGHVREFTGKEMAWMAEQAGFKLVKLAFRNIYFEWRWFLRPRRYPALLAYLLSQLYPAGRDHIFIILEK